MEGGVETPQCYNEIKTPVLIGLNMLIGITLLKVPLRVQQFLCFWKLFVALNNCANFLAF